MLAKTRVMIIGSGLLVLLPYTALNAQTGDSAAARPESPGWIQLHVADALADKYVSCVVQQTLRLGRGNHEQARDVALAATGHCDNQIVDKAYLEAMLSDGINPSVVNQHKDRYPVIASNEAVAALIEARVSRGH